MYCIGKMNLAFLVACVSRYSINTYVQYLSYALLVIAELPNDELTGNHTLSLPPPILVTLNEQSIVFPIMPQ